MNRRVSLQPLVRRLFSLLVVSALTPAFAPAERPDILMIAIDDLRPMLGCYGDQHVKTPNIDSLASSGVVFDRAYCQYAKCGTSRLSLMTGLRPDSIGVFSNNKKDVTAFRKRRPDVASLARWLRESGYHTQSFGKIYHDGWDNPNDWTVPASPGRDREMWEVVDDTDPMSPTIIAERLKCPVMQSPDVQDEHLFAGRMTEQAITELKRFGGRQPRFVAVGYRRPHLPFVAPKRFYDLYQPDDSWLATSPMPASNAPVMAWFNSDGYVTSAKRVGLEMPLRPNRSQAVEWNGYEMRSYLGVPNHGPISATRQRELIHAYAACISYVDAQIGKLLHQLRDSSRLKHTVILLWSDHGWHLGEQSAWGKMTNFEIATRVPLIIVAPEVRPARTPFIAELVDLYPTLCELADTETPPHLEGESLVPVLGAPDVKGDSVALSQYSRFRNKYMGRALRTDRYRYVAWFEAESGRVVQRELYDHATDEDETHNIADTNQVLVRRLETKLRERFHLTD